MGTFAPRLPPRLDGAMPAVLHGRARSSPTAPQKKSAGRTSMKQYVNFDQAHETATRHEGARVPLRVTRQLWTGIWEGRAGNAPNRKLEWEVVADPANIARDIVCAA
ncbi:MAG: hypothetical protein ABI134_27590, partial [Byssovorax sp.]